MLGLIILIVIMTVMRMIRTECDGQWIINFAILGHPSLIIKDKHFKTQKLQQSLTMKTNMGVDTLLVVLSYMVMQILTKIGCLVMVEEILGTKPHPRRNSNTFL